MASDSDSMAPHALRGRKARSRKDRPCDACRRRKVRCYIEPGEISCALCRSEAQQCTFNEQPSERKRKRDGLDAAELSKTAKKPFTRVYLASNPEESCSSDSDQISRLAEGHLQALAAITASRRQTTNAVHSMPPPIMSTPTLTLYNGTTLNYVGGAELHESVIDSDDSSVSISTSATQRAGNARTEENNVLDVSTDSVNSGRFTLIRDTDHTDDKAMSLPRLSTLPEILACFGPDSASCIQLYFRHVHPIYPVLCRARSEEQAKHLCATLEGSMDPSATPLLAAMLTVASQWWSFDPALSMRSTPNLVPLQNFVRHAFSLDLRMPRIVTIQAALLHYLVLPFGSERSAPDTWASVGAMVASAQNLGLHQNPEQWNIQPWEIRLRKRLWWAILMADKWLALGYGRPSHIHTESWTVRHLSPADFTDEGIPAGEHFQHMTGLTCILSDVLTELYSPRSAPSLLADASATLKVTAPLLDRVEAWFAQLPPSLSCLQRSGADFSDEEFNANGSLHVAYYVVKVAIHRAIMRCVHDTGDAPRQHAIHTMKSIAQMTKELGPTHLLSVWFSYSHQGWTIISNFMLSMLLTARTDDEFKSLKAILQSYKWHLTIHANAFPSLLKAALRRIDQFYVEGNDQLEKMWRRRAGVIPFPAVGPPKNILHVIPHPSDTSAPQELPTPHTSTELHSQSMNDFDFGTPGHAPPLQSDNFSVENLEGLDTFWWLTADSSLDSCPPPSTDIFIPPQDFGFENLMAGESFQGFGFDGLSGGNSSG